MSKFTASNEHRVTVVGAGVLEVQAADGGVRHTLGSHSVKALREFFQHERDEELGRWRWPENPDYVVYPFRDGSVEVLHEVGPETGYYYPDEPERFTTNKGRVARAYFEAHPKPWHDAKEGEVWVITVDGNQYPAIFQAGMFRDTGGGWPAESISDARRIWPEES